MTSFMDRAASGHFTLITLTDEELSALGSEEQLAPRPWYDALDEAGQKVGREVALRGLIARGIVSAEDVGDDRARMQMSESMETMLTIREAPAYLVLATRLAGEAAWSRLLYCRPERVAVEEDVDAFGLHTISAGPLDELAVRLAEFCDPHGAARQDGEPRSLPLTEIARGAGQEVFGRANYLTHLVRVTLDDSGEPEEERVSVYTLDDRVVVTESALDGENGVLVMADASEESLRARARALLQASPSVVA